MASVRWSEQALDDLDAVCLFIARDAPMAAELFARSVFETTDRLEAFPQSGREVPETGRADIRELIVGNYRVIYQLLDEDAVILTVHHGARLLDDLQQ